MVDCLCNGPSIYDHYRSDKMKTSRQVITLNMTQALILPHLLLFSLINKKALACDVRDHILSATLTACDLTFSARLEESAKQLILTVLGFSFSRVDVELCSGSL